MTVAFLGKNITTHVRFKATDESWYGTPWFKLLDQHTIHVITVTSTDGTLDEVEVRAEANPGAFVVIQPEEISDAPGWLVTLAERTVELV